MEAKVNLGQILQGGLAALVGWLFKTVNDMQQEVATLKVEDEDKIGYITQTTLSMDDTSEIINMLKNDENIRMIFSISQSFNNNWDIISSNNSAFEYYISTMNQYSREFLKFQWDEYLDEDKQPFIDAVKIIRNNITNKINNIWTTKIQELLYLITPHNNSYQLRTHYILF